MIRYEKEGETQNFVVAGQLTHSGLNQARAPNTFCSSELSDLLCFQYFILQKFIVFLKKKSIHKLLLCRNIAYDIAVKP